MNTLSKRTMITIPTIITVIVTMFGSANARMVDGFSDDILRSILKSFPSTTKTTYLNYKKPFSKRMLSVTATAYTSHVGQTDSTPNIAAWGDRLRPGMKVIAVSRDLLNQYGLERGSKVKIHGQPGHYVVLDKMNKRWKKKIDIYMGKDKREAFKWGKRKVTIEWDSALTKS